MAAPAAARPARRPRHRARPAHGHAAHCPARPAVAVLAGHLVDLCRPDQHPRQPPPVHRPRHARNRGHDPVRADRRRLDRGPARPADGRFAERLHDQPLGPAQTVHPRRLAPRRRRSCTAIAASNFARRDRCRSWSCCSSAATSPRARSRATSPTSCRPTRSAWPARSSGLMQIMGQVAGFTIGSIAAVTHNYFLATIVARCARADDDARASYSG